MQRCVTIEREREHTTPHTHKSQETSQTTPVRSPMMLALNSTRWAQGERRGGGEIKGCANGKMSDKSTYYCPHTYIHTYIYTYIQIYTYIYTYIDSDILMCTPTGRTRHPYGWYIDGKYGEWRTRICIYSILSIPSLTH